MLPVQVEQLPAFPLSYSFSSVIVPFHIYKDKSGKAAACNKELYFLKINIEIWAYLA
jgi:hypothetical protein